MALFWQWEEQAQAAIHSQQSEHRRRSYNIIQNSIYSDVCITSLIYNSDFSQYPWTQDETIGMCTAQESPILRWSYLYFRRGVFHPYLISGTCTHIAKALITCYIGTCLVSYYPSKSFLKRICFPDRSDILTRWKHQQLATRVGSARRSLESNGSSWSRSKGLGLGGDEESKSYLDRQLNLVLINVVLIIRIKYPHNIEYLHYTLSVSAAPLRGHITSAIQVNPCFIKSVVNIIFKISSCQIWWPGMQIICNVGLVSHVKFYNDTHNHTSGRKLNVHITPILIPVYDTGILNPNNQYNIH